jgi:UPF0755 protein
LRFILRAVLALITISVVVGGAISFHVWREFEAPGPAALYGNGETIVALPAGTGLGQIAQTLEDRRVVRSALIFRAGVMYYRQASSLKAGEYAIPSGASPMQIMHLLIEGKAIVYKLTLPEGITTAMIVDLVRKHVALSGEVSLSPAEGTLLPETYVFNRGTSRDSIIQRMQSDHIAVLDEIWVKRASDLPFATKNEAVTLASIVEKETGIASERPRVAAVFVNRLRKGMKLQSDPTIIYGLTGGVPLGRGIRQSELEKATPYNTYVIDGLPPTPIANPGRASMEAVLNPALTDDLYFVADGTGGHAFASTLAEHEKNVQKWRQIERQRASNTGGNSAAPSP